MRQENPFFCTSLGKNIAIRRTVQSLFVQVRGVVSNLAQEIHRGRRDSHIGQEPHCGVDSNGWIVSSVNQAAYFKACRMSSASRYG